MTFYHVWYLSRGIEQRYNFIKNLNIFKKNSNFQLFRPNIYFSVHGILIFYYKFQFFLNRVKESNNTYIILEWLGKFELEFLSNIHILGFVNSIKPFLVIGQCLLVCVVVTTQKKVGK